MNHLNVSTAELLSLSDIERIERIRSPRWIGYPKAKSILDKLEDLMVYPKSHRMPNLLLVGDTNNGKTMLVRRFFEKHPPDDNADGEGVRAPVVFVQAPPTADEGRFYSAILELLFAKYRPSDRIDKKQFQVIKLLKYVRMQVLVIDEIHHILAGSTQRQRTFLNVLKYLGNELQVPIVAVGTRDAFSAIQTDPQLSNRFEPVLLPRWEFDTEFLRLLVSFERMLPLRKPSQLHGTKLATKLFSLSEGYIGELARLLAEAAAQAITSGCETITEQVLKDIHWVSPRRPQTPD